MKQSYHHGNLKAEFVRIAFEFVHHEDIDKLTLKVLSEQTNTSRSAIYKHFSSKDELLKAVMEKAFEEFDSILVPILSNPNEKLIDRFFNASYAYINWAKANPNLYRFLFTQKYAYIRESFITIKNQECKSFVALQNAVEEGQKQGLLKDGDSLNYAIVIWSSLHGLSSLVLDSFKDVELSYESVLQSMIQTLLTGIVK